MKTGRPMQKSFRHILVITSVLLTVCSINIVIGQQPADPRQDKKIIIAKAGAELKTPKAVVWRAYLGEVFTIQQTNGEWLWIKEKEGWLWEKEAVYFDTAIEELSQRVKVTPTADNYHLRGVAFLAHENYDNAIADFSESLRKSPRNVGALNNRGQASYLKGDYKSAVTDFSGAVVMDPKNFLAFNNRALTYLEMEELDLALSDLQSALKLVPEYSEALNNRGIVYQKMKKYDEAIADFTAALKIDPRYTDALGNRAYTLQLKKEYGKAIADLELAMKSNPDSYEAINDLAWLLATATEPSVRSGARSLELATQACNMTDNKQWNTLDTLAAAYAETGQWDKAKEWLTTALANAPDKEKPRLQGHLDLVIGQMPIRQ
jgi:tetratricopeptide (TPR) repeat protein